MIHEASKDTHLPKPSIEETKTDADSFQKSISFDGQNVCIDCMVDCSYNVIPRPKSEDVQEVCCTRRKQAHALKCPLLAPF